MMTSTVFYLALLFSLGTCAVVNMAPEISEGKTDEVINDLEEIVEELKVDEMLIQNSKVDFPLENTNINVKYHAPSMKCSWDHTTGNCCFQLYMIPSKICVIMRATYPHVNYEVKSGTRAISRGYLNDHYDDHEVDIHYSYFKLEFELKLRYLSKEGIVMCFKADYHTHAYKFDNGIGCTINCFKNSGCNRSPSMSIV
ncbi:uncharacterized protein LOC106876290 [Octopus bimaculoides]|uniref:DUF4773 domain-containing protein n=1 Tax=Octopus bimaculoides TaxID=37653 RepID=A0A0L8GLC6_OCTBM|nr:uncharacterized protein LOC106876290 [Octopus bimaculoides]|eukprot:XP_014780271.1 PREDICTED: uncharacterized protein LOC106876290 [Octopus bimaculoides]